MSAVAVGVRPAPGGEPAPCGGVGISATGMWQVEGGRMVEALSRAQILRGELARGSPEQRPGVSALLGGVLCAPGWVVARQVVLLTSGADLRISLRLEATLLLLVIVGVWLLFKSLVQRRYFVRVHLQDRVVRLVFETSVSLVEIRAYVAAANTRFGWAIQDGLALSR